MASKHEVELINHMLKSVPKQHKTVAEQMLYERGYLTGFLASLAEQDNYVKSAIIKRIKDLDRRY